MNKEKLLQPSVWGVRRAAGVCPASTWGRVYSHLRFSGWCFPDPMVLSSALGKFKTLLFFHPWLLCSCLPYLHMLFSQPWLRPPGFCLFLLFFWAKLPAPHPNPDSVSLSWLPKCCLQFSSCYRAILGSGYRIFFGFVISPGLVWRVLRELAMNLFFLVLSGPFGQHNQNDHFVLGRTSLSPFKYLKTLMIPGLEFYL